MTQQISQLNKPIDNCQECGKSLELHGVPGMFRNRFCCQSCEKTGKKKYRAGQYKSEKARAASKGRKVNKTKAQRDKEEYDNRQRTIAKHIANGGEI